ncbi:NUDIX domain-containing protein [Paenibacillus nuruki]|uniref:NUDIX domain-containing protein n=1 Tax=Paenibacillus nuruki TaxID=1886670 RepID=UPI002803CF2C|nr:NUDIX domain-containing protein [Paenibacillus nuruki]CAJ1314747.1 NUDIX domain-containing protein [Paenibacillus nuruki]
MSKINQAINFVLNNVDIPAYQHKDLEKEFKDKIKSSESIIKNMKKVGDLHNYLKRFKNIPVLQTPESKLYERFNELGLETYESIYPEFYSLFENDLEDTTVLNDFIIGNDYTSWDISIFSKTYDNRSGIYLVGKNGNPEAIFIKATLLNGNYSNEWIIKDEKLKYYFYSRSGKFSEKYVYNSAILNSKASNIPIYVFIKEGTILNLNGIYEYESHDSDLANGSMWFILNKISSLEIQNLITDAEYIRETQLGVEYSINTDSVERKIRLANAIKIPESFSVVTKAFKRNADVIVEVLRRANGICENCLQKAPFIRASNNTAYLEVHHIIPLADGGEDTLENAIAVCPNCHREAHLGIPVKIVTAALIVHEGKILITCRGPGRSQEGLWEFPGGKLEQGETLEECLEREISEELSMKIKVIQHYDDSIYTYSEGSIRLKAYWCKWIDGNINLIDHSEYKWISLSDLPIYNFAPADIKLQNSLNQLNYLF